MIAPLLDDAFFGVRASRKTGDDRCRILVGDNRDTLRSLPDKSVQCVITSPPYFGLRSYLPGVVRLREDAPAWVLEELTRLGITEWKP